MPVAIRNATLDDCDILTDGLVEAFASDPVINFLFQRKAPGDASDGVRAFFHTLLQVRIAIGMPCLAATVNNELAGAAMGYDCTRPRWPEPYKSRWVTLLNQVPGVGSRLDAYDTEATRFEPQAPHYYLGVLGVADRFRGTGVGKALLRAYCELSNRDPGSAGVYLDTSSPHSLEFYLRNGFSIAGEGSLGGTPLWCVFYPSGRR